MTKVTLEKVNIYAKKSDGSEYITKKGEKFKIGVIVVDGERYSCCLFNPQQEETVAGWKDGDRVDVILEKGDPYSNFKLPNKLDAALEEIESLKKRVDVLEGNTAVTQGDINAALTPDDLPDFD